MLHYPLPEEGRIAAVEKTFRDCDPRPSTGNNMSLLALAVEGMKVHPGDALRAYSTEGMLVGQGAFGQDERCGLAIWGDDPTTEARDGLLEGEAFSLKLFALVEEELSPVGLELSAGSTLDGNGLIYATDDFTALNLCVSDAIPTEYYLAGCYPNPFNSTTRIDYGLPEAAEVKLQVFDLQGRLVETLVLATLPAGRHSLLWQSDDLAAGLYLVRMETPLFSSASKAMLVK